MRLKQLRMMYAALIPSLAAVSVMVLSHTAFAAQDCTWTGNAGDDAFATAGNWANCGGGVPQEGDTVVFNSSATGTVNLTDNLGYALGGLTVTETNGNDPLYIINSMAFTSGAIIDTSHMDNGGADFIDMNINSVTADGALTIDGGQNGAGRLQLSNWQPLSGLLTLNGSAATSPPVSAISATYGVALQNGATLYFGASAPTVTVPNFPITLGGGSGSAEPVLDFSAYQPGLTAEPTTWTFANPITLDGNAYIQTEQDVTVNQTGSITGSGYEITDSPQSYAGSTLVLDPSSNSSATVAGTYTGSDSESEGGFSGGSSSNSSNKKKAPKTPDTGASLASSHALLTFAGTTIAATTLVAVARTRKPVTARLRP